MGVLDRSTVSTLYSTPYPRRIVEFHPHSGAHLSLLLIEQVDKVILFFFFFYVGGGPPRVGSRE